jgi:hypothetical protein
MGIRTVMPQLNYKIIRCWRTRHHDDTKSACPMNGWIN